MSFRIITGSTGDDHISAGDDGGLNAGIVGNEDYVLNIGQKLSATISGNTAVVISDGEIMMQGRHGRINPNSTETVTLGAGAQGSNRIDIIAVEYKKTGDVESMELKAVRGTPSSNPVAPVLTTGDIRGGSVLHQMALYNVRIEGIAISAVTPVFRTLPTLAGFDSNFTSSVNALILEAKKAMFPVGSIFMSASSANPSTYMGFGTWTAYAQGRVILGAGNGTDVNNVSQSFTAGATGGAYNEHAHTHSLAGHQHFISEHVHTVAHDHAKGTLELANNGNHSHNAYYDSQKVANGTDRNYYSAAGTNESSTASGHRFTSSAGSHTHTISGRTASATPQTSPVSLQTLQSPMQTTSTSGSGSAHNLQPYIACYVWRRTA